ncbi:MAG: hydrogenase maturation nickel metallochaperone HypA [Methanobrevibacter sp.]|jgi:hydrogenase nickel incorporation protein HypA/HybF|nr:hydrogenase maturation nickel metallochaperone HypA [Candidatus Methanoflexus mossambicus]
MHEMAMADSILKSVIENAKNNDAIKVLDVVVEFGQLALLNPEQVKFMLDVLSEDTIAEGANFVIESIPIEIKCGECDYLGTVDGENLDHYAPIIQCPKCDTRHIEVLNGKDVIVKKITIDKDPVNDKNIENDKIDCYKDKIKKDDD